MADFNDAYEKMILNEGGYKLHNVRGDRGGQTYAGIARNYHPNWPGWRYIDDNDIDNPELTERVRDFYKENFWDKIKGDQIEAQSVAETLFDFAVNAGHRTAAKLAQLVLGATPDGIIGPKTLEKLNQFEGEEFNIRYALAKVARYVEIVNRDRSQEKFLLGWINRTLKGAA
jgi:lysozyme family protein